MSQTDIRSPSKRKQDGAYYRPKMDQSEERKSRKLEKSQAEVERHKKMLVRSWVSITRQKYPKFLKRPYLMPPVHFRRVTYDVVDTAGTVPVKVPVPATQMSNVREDETQQRIHNIMAAMFHEQSSDVMIIQFGLEFDNYLNNNKGLEMKRSDNAPSSGGLSPRNTTRDEQRQHQQYKTVSINNHRQVLSLKWSTPNGHQPHNECDDLPPIQENGKYDPSLDTGNLDLALFSRPRDLHSALRRGRFDILIIHRDFGILIFEVKAVGDAFSLSEEVRTSVSKQNAIIRSRLQKSLKQLHKEEIVLRFLLKDLGLEKVPVTKGLVLPNLSKQTVRLALMEDPCLMEMFIKCLNGDSVNGDQVEKAMEKCVFSDYLPPIGYCLGEYNDATTTLYTCWWLNIKKGLKECKAFTNDQYETVVSRFCGPATNQWVSSAHNERAEVSTLPDAVMEVSRCYRQLVISREHLEMLRVPHKHVWLTGQTGSNTEVLLLLKALQSLKEGRQVLLLSLWHGSDAVTRTLYHQILNYAKDSVKDQLRVLCSIDAFPDKLVSSPKTTPEHTADESLPSDDLQDDGEDIDANLNSCQSQTRVLEDPVQAVASFQKGLKCRNHKEPYFIRQHCLDALKEIVIIAPQAAWFCKDIFRIYKKLFSEFEIWASSSFPLLKPDNFVEINLPQIIRRPPVVVKEARASVAHDIFSRPPVASLDAGTLAGMPHPTDGPAVKRLSHVGHGSMEVWDCQQCGKELALYLCCDLGLCSDPGSSLRYSDVLISGYFNLPSCRMDFYAWKELPGFLQGLEQLSIPFTVFGQQEGVKLADAEQGPHCKASGLQVVHADCLLGLERPVVVVLAPSDVKQSAPRYVDPWYDVVSCCTSQLVVVGDLASNGGDCHCPFGSFIEAIMKELTT